MEPRHPYVERRTTVRVRERERERDGVLRKRNNVSPVWPDRWDQGPLGNESKSERVGGCCWAVSASRPAGLWVGPKEREGETSQCYRLGHRLG